jgi:cytochrome c peroxidase
VFNYRNFWDGRANNIFNGVNPFGPRDPNAKVLELQPDGSTNWTAIALPNASLASQAVGPALSEFEMSCANRTFKDLGRKLLALQPLHLQDVHPEDSVIGSHATPTGRGLKESYPDLIRAAFDPRWWDAPARFNGYTQMESNFSMFWGLAIMMYESTLVSDETPFDKFVGYPGSPGNANALTAQQQRGLAVFRGNGQCGSCHKGAEFTGAATALQPGDAEGTVIESMFLKTGELAIYDNGFYNIGVRPTAEDRGVGGTDPFGNPLSFTRNWFELLRKQPVGDPVWVDPCLFSIFSDANACWIAPEPDGTRVVTDGAFKTPSLRNIALTQPYFHNGGVFTLEQVVEFYNRGGDRRGPDDNDTTGFVAPDAPNGGTTNVHPAINPLGLTLLQRTDLVAFLRFALTDPRVACEQAPFDHPSLSVHDGHVGDEISVKDSNRDGKADDLFLLLPAVGAKGLPKAQCLRNDNGSAVAGI